MTISKPAEITLSESGLERMCQENVTLLLEKVDDLTKASLHQDPILSGLEERIEEIGNTSKMF